MSRNSGRKVKSNPKVSIHELYDEIHYDYRRGKIFWHDDDCVLNGYEKECEKECYDNFEECGFQAKSGYRFLKIGGKMITAHRVIFAMHHERWAKYEIRHLDGDRTNNKVTNLREMVPNKMADVA